MTQKKKLLRKRKDKIRKNKTSKALKVIDFLTLLSKSKNKKKIGHLIDYAERKEILGICECVYNFLRGNIKIPQKDIAKMKPYRKTIREIIDKKKSIKHIKKLIKQRGGFLNRLMPRALEMIKPRTLFAVTDGMAKGATSAMKYAMNSFKK